MATEKRVVSYGEQHMKEKVLKLLMGYFRASGRTVGPVYEHIISEVEKL